jgi:hypothetical protein
MMNTFNNEKLSDRWTKQVLKRGFTGLPNLLLEHQCKLGLSAVDMNIVAQIVSHWHRASEFPFPGVALLAARVGLSTRSVQRSLRRMEQKGLIARVRRFNSSGGQTSNSYCFDGLIGALGSPSSGVMEPAPGDTAADQTLVLRNS